MFLFQTYLGDVLLAVNPNKMIPIYGEEVKIKMHYVNMHVQRSMHMIIFSDFLSTINIATIVCSNCVLMN